MAEENKVYYPETIEQNPLPILGDIVLDKNQETSGKEGNKQYTALEISQLPYPQKTIAIETIGATLNTQSRKILGSFSFGKIGAIQVGEYENGVSGDVRISPDGIVARNEDGDTTFSLDGMTGNATFLGTIAAGSVIVGQTNIGSGSYMYMDGVNNRLIVNDGTNDRVLIGKF